MKEIILITGLSGAGKSQAAGILEDMGFYCVDNLPVELMTRFAELCLAAEGKYARTALVSDLRGQGNPERYLDSVLEFKAAVPGLKILFLEAQEQVIVNRYKETRHRHPLDPSGTNLLDAIRREREAMQPVRSMADMVVDTSEMPLAALKLRLGGLFSDGKDDEMSLHICSFGFKNGLPAGADLVLDVRFLPNPYYVPALKPLSGLDAPVRDYVCSFPDTRNFLQKLWELLEFLLPLYRREGKTSLLIAVGCTGGHHRSVAIAEALTEKLVAGGYPADCVHRDLR